MQKKEYIKKFLDLDWTEKPYIFVLGLLFILSRIPLLNLGFGSDPDAWRIAGSAFDLHYFGIYHPSRFPGYPLPEFFNSLIINYGWLATNAATVILSLISVYVFARILKELNIKNKGLLVVTYAFLPILWINSAITMDYMWALAFILLTWFFIIRKQYALAGLMMGLAIGSRITSLILILPFIYLILAENKEIKKIMYFFVTTCATALILFLPLYLQYGLNFVSYYPTQTGMDFIWYDMTYYFGILAILFGLMLSVISFNKLFENVIKKEEIIKKIKGNNFLLYRTDRADLSKNIIRGFKAYELFLQKHPEFHGKVVFLSTGMPTRQQIKEYCDYRDESYRIIDSINERYSKDGWVPIKQIFKADYGLVTAAFKHYDCLLVNPIVDGMNIVAKEGPVVNENNGVLIMSNGAGSYEELKDYSIIVNAYDISQTADAIYRAIMMSKHERQRLIEGLKKTVGERNVYIWMQEQFNDIRKLF